MHHSPPPPWGCPSPRQQHLCLLAHLLPLCLLESILHTTNIKQSRCSTLNPIMPFYSQPSSPPVLFRRETQTVFAYLHFSGHESSFPPHSSWHPWLSWTVPGTAPPHDLCACYPTAVNSLPQGWILSHVILSNAFSSHHNTQKSEPVCKLHGDLFPLLCLTVTLVSHPIFTMLPSPYCRICVCSL